MNDYNLIKPIYYEKSKENEIAIYQEANLKYAHKLNVSSPSLSLCVCVCVVHSYLSPDAFLNRSNMCYII